MYRKWYAIYHLLNIFAIFCSIYLLYVIPIYVYTFQFKSKMPNYSNSGNPTVALCAYQPCATEFLSLEDERWVMACIWNTSMLLSETVIFKTCLEYWWLVKVHSESTCENCDLFAVQWIVFARSSKINLQLIGLKLGWESIA